MSVLRAPGHPAERPVSHALWRALAALLLVAAVAPPAPARAAATDMIRNGSFEQTGSTWRAPWYFVVRSGAAATVARTGSTKADGRYAARVTVTQGSSSAPWLVQLSQSGLRLTAGLTYRVSFAARADVSRPLEAVLQQTASPYPVHARKSVVLTTEWTTFDFSYRPTTSDADGALHFNLAGAPGKVWLDDVRVTVRVAKGIVWRKPAEHWRNDLAGIESDLRDMKAGNVDWARLDLYHSEDPDPVFDRIVRSARGHGIRLLVVVHKPRPYKDLGTESERAEHKAWLGGVVRRYKYHVKHWEVMNEPNLHYEWSIDESPHSDAAQYGTSVQRYVAHLKDSYQTIKAADPGAAVLFGGLSEWTVERYMDALLTTDAYRYFDIMSFHPYGRDPGRVLGRFESFRSKLAQNRSYAAKPVWVTEIGFNTSWTNKAGYVSSEERKAEYLALTMRRLYAAGAS
jgi:SAM-dependent methyltransferase